MATTRGRSAVKRFIGELPGKLRDNVLRGAARAGAGVIAEEAKADAPDIVAANVAVRTKREDLRMVATVHVKGQWPNSVGIWAEYGTDPHYISVDDEQRQGMSVKRINTLEKDKRTLVINGKPVGRTVWHPGARAIPFLRPALDRKEGDAITAAQAHIDARIARGSIDAAEPRQDGDE